MKSCSLETEGKLVSAGQLMLSLNKRGKGEKMGLASCAVSSLCFLADSELLRWIDWMPNSAQTHLANCAYGRGWTVKQNKAVLSACPLNTALYCTTAQLQCSH